ncbi:LamB/YcsF family protein [Bifidobacterium sp.]|jgi:UPF0271 protein|uniref:LamB/YcsF family protein n=1 Tax=Bifidobacterium sp. TaxID=41200 RepID=UPI0025BB210D|nr:5-oxoprolinase subunit PxpA [Bifidobacterium sp.]MCI1635946.1 LamB/YcsF family protein [Bifidobacterium sp.]
MVSIDINSDMGESFGRWTLGDDTSMLGLISSANIACGFHAGDPSVMLRTLTKAHQHQVCIGAHVSYRDLAGFGRRSIDVPAEVLQADVEYQLAAIQGLANATGSAVRYVKPHGALYNRIVDDEVQASAVVHAIVALNANLGLLTLPDSAVGKLADEAGLRVFHEAFADRAYTPEGRLVSRNLPDSVISDPAAVAQRVSQLVLTHHIEAIDGSTIAVSADSVCVHGDTPGAVAMAKSINHRLSEDGINIASFMDR